MQTSVTQILDSKGIKYVVRRHTKEVYTCKEAAAERGVEPSQIVKSMVGEDGDGQLHVMMIPGDRVLKIKKARQVAGGIRIELISPEELAKRANVIVGAISPTQFLGQARFYIDHRLLQQEEVTISSGSPLAGVMLKASDLCRLVDAISCDIVSTRGG